MSFGAIPFGESTLAGPSIAVAIPAGPPAQNVVDVIIDPYTIEISGQSMTGKQLIDTLSIDSELGRQSSARFTILNISPVPEIGAPVRILFYSNVLFVGAIDSISIQTNNLSTFITYDIECTDNSYLLFRKKIKYSFSNLTVSNITSSMIGLELGNDGVTIGSISSNPVIPVATADGVSVYEFLSGIATSIGTVFQVNESKQINYLGAQNQPVGTDLDENNVETCDVKFDRETYRNKNTCTVTGTAPGGTPLSVTLTRSNADQIAQRAAIEGTSGVYSEIVSLTHPTSNSSIELTRLANSYGKICCLLFSAVLRTLSPEL
jgi:hypothetical protein